MKFLRLLTIIFLLPICACNKQTSYEVDGNISNEVDRLITKYKISDMGFEADFLFHIRKTFNYNDFKINDASDLSYFLESQDILSKNYTPNVCSCYLGDDTLNIVGGQGYAGGVVFIIQIVGKTVFGQVAVSTTQDVYAISQKSNELTDELRIKAAKLDLVLSEKPRFEIGQILIGKVYFEGEPFYQLNHQEELEKINTKFDIAFKCRVEKHSFF